MESGVMASPTYQNFPGASRRRPPPPPPRTPSPELRSPPALPPRNYLRRDEEAADCQEGEEGGNVDEAKIDFKSLVHQWESNSPRENDYAVELRKQAMMKFSGQRGSTSTTPSSASMSVIHSRTQMGISTSYKREPMVAQEATTPTSSAASSTSTTPSVSSTSSLSAGASSSSAHRQSGSEVSPSAADGPAVSVTAQTKEYFPQHAAAAYVDRDSKPTLRDAPVTSSSARPPQLPERTVLPPREDGHAAPRADNLPPRGESHLPRDRNVSEVPRKDPERSFLCPPDVSRERSSSDTLAQAKPEVCAVPATVRDNSRSPAGKHSDQPLPSPSRGDNQEGVVDPSELPPPPPELLNSSDGTFDKGDQQGEDPFADDSYGAYRNRSSRQVGTYKRSASAAVILPDNHHLKAATDAHAVFSDRKLGNQNWNSDSQLQSRSREAQQGGSGGGGSSNSNSGSNGVGGPPGRPPDRAGNVPAFKADSGPVRGGVVKVSGVQPTVPHGHPQGQGQSPAGAGRGGGGGETFTARPYHVEQSRAVAPPEEEAARPGSAPSPKQPRSVKERISNLERKSSFSSSSSATPTPTASPMHTAGTPTATPTSTHTPTPTPTSQRWANAAPFGATHRAGAENLKPQRGNNSSSNSSGSNNNRVPTSRSMVLTDPYQGRERDRPASGSPASAAPASSTQNSVSARPRAYSERSKQGGEAAPSPSDPRPSQRFAEVAPMASDARALPGHVRNSSQASAERPRSSSSPYNRRESAPAPQIPPDTAVAMVSPRRKSEGNFLSSHAEVDKERSPPAEMTIISHGRQPSQEELECDQQAKELAREVAGSEKKLSDVLNADSTKKRMKYMDGLFSSPLDGEVKTPASVRRHQSQGPGDRSSPQQLLHPQPQPTASADATDAKPAEDAGSHKKNSLPKEYFVSPPKAVLEMEWRNKEEATDLTKNIHDNEALIKQKEELIGKLYKKADLLKEERKSLQEEIEENDALGKRVREAVDAKCKNPNERDKFQTYIDDLEKIVRLLLNLSGQLARAENAVQGLPDNADPKLKKMTLDKRERLQVKHAEAKQLKEDIDKRSETVSAFLRLSLTAEELQDYAYFIKMKSKLTIELQELEDKITLGQEQIQELKKSIPERIAPPAPSSSPSSPPSSPVPSS